MARVSNTIQSVIAIIAVIGCSAGPATRLFAEPPHASYIFPMGGQQGTQVAAKIGGHYFHQSSELIWNGKGAKAPARVERATRRTWFEGPRIPMPDSQRKEDYAWPYKANVSIEPNATPSLHWWRIRTAQGVTQRRPFVIGSLPEHVEQEFDGRPVPVHVTTPITINGRIFPREDVDIWTFQAKAGQRYVCEVAAARLMSPLDSHLKMFGPDGSLVAENGDGLGIGNDSRLVIKAKQSGRFQVHIYDAEFRGLQDYTYRLTITDQFHATAVYPLGGTAGSETEFHWLSPATAPRRQTIMLADSDRARNTASATAIQLAPPGTGLPVTVETSEFPEIVEPLSTKNDPMRFEPSSGTVLNGRIAAPGEVDTWRFDAEQGSSFRFDVRAARLGSQLDSRLTIHDAMGAELAASKGGDPSGDALLRWKAPKSGEYQLRVTDSFSDGGPRHFAYRIVVTRQSNPSSKPRSFQLVVANDVIEWPLAREATEDGNDFVWTPKEAVIDITVEGHSGFSEPIHVIAEGLPQGVVAAPLTISPKTKKAKLKLATESVAAVGSFKTRPISLWGVVYPKSKANGAKGKTINAAPPTGIAKRLPPFESHDELPVRRAVRVGGAAASAVGAALAPSATLRLTPVLRTPFRFTGKFETRYGACGSEFRRNYMIERNGFAGPLQVGMADRQTRHLQGVTGNTIDVGSDADSFEFKIRLAPWMEVGRTSRTCLMLTGAVEGPFGKRHRLCYTSAAQNDQIIVLVDPAPLAIVPSIASLNVQADSTTTIPFRVARGALRGDVRVELIVPPHIAGIACDAVVIPTGKQQGILRVRMGKQPGPTNMPLTVRATLLGRESYVAEAKIDL